MIFLRTQDLFSLTPSVSKIAEDCVVHIHVKPAVLDHLGKDALISMLRNWCKALIMVGEMVEN